MSKNWIWDAIFTALATVASFGLDALFEAKNIMSRKWSIPVSILISAAMVGILLRLAVTSFPLRFRFFRRRVAPAADIEGLWLERIDRHGDQHYSIFNFKYSETSRIDPFSMSGNSFFPDGTKHSHWGTESIRIEKKPDMITAYYIFSAVLQSAAGSPPSGYGEARFEYRSNGDIYLDGSGFYINVEDVGKTAKSPEPFFCPYVLRRIDDKFKKSINAENEELNNEESERNFIIKAHAYFVGQENTPTQLQGPNAH